MNEMNEIKDRYNNIIKKLEEFRVHSIENTHVMEGMIDQNIITVDSLEKVVENLKAFLSDFDEILEKAIIENNKVRKEIKDLQ